MARIRSIPACAGEPSAQQATTQGKEVYPRVCGGTAAIFSSSLSISGLSPRVRGNPHLGDGLQDWRGSIPACAGEPRSRVRLMSSTGVYPRVCGGTGCSSPTASDARGLSPRVRGNRAPPPSLAVRSRSIPACAGEPRPGHPPCLRAWVYPRVCGGTSCLCSTAHSQHGLSPRVRGNRKSRTNARRLTRSIPACAGEPALPSARPLRYPVYPRVCGGTDKYVASGMPAEGLSPRVRGNPHLTPPSSARTRSIPACAGEPSGESTEFVSTRVYPRVCGGTSFADAAVVNGSGLSPRVRGNRG